MLNLNELVEDVADAITNIDSSGASFKSFQPGVGPYGEPQLVKLIAGCLNSVHKYNGMVLTKRTPDILIPKEWALEFKIARPFGDNGKLAENWSVNLLHPYPGNASTIGDCLKLADLKGSERLAAIVIGYEHSSPRIDLLPLIQAFEAIASRVVGIRLSKRVEIRRGGLIHPVHQAVRLFAWEVMKSDNR